MATQLKPGNYRITTTDGEASVWIDGDHSLLNVDGQVLKDLLTAAMDMLYADEPQRKRPTGA